jgi:hypothetical protein
LRDRDLGALRQQHPDGNLQSSPGWVHDTDRPISALRFASDPQGNTMKRVKGVEDLNIYRRSGYCGRGCYKPHMHMTMIAPTLSSLTAKGGFLHDCVRITFPQCGAGGFHGPND